MYNLIVPGSAGTWDGSRYKLERSRVAREYTDDAIAEKYKVLNEVAISELQSFPVLFAYEESQGADARLGFLKRIQSRAGQVQFEYGFWPGLPAIGTAAIPGLTWELDIDKWEMNRTHWAVKAVDLLAVLVDSGLVTSEHVARLPGHLVRPSPQGMASQLVITPSVFGFRSHDREPDLVSVMMPFDKGFTEVYVAIQHACTDAGLRCLRADDMWQESAVVHDVFNLLFRSKVVVVDFSGRNRNVMYETGIAHTLGRPVIPISQSLDDVPFDLRHDRVLRYLPNSEGLASMRTILVARLKTLSRVAG